MFRGRRGLHLLPLLSLYRAVDVGGAQPKKWTFRKFSYRGVNLDQLLDMGTDELVKLFPARARRRFQRGLKRKPMALIKMLRKAVLSVSRMKFVGTDELPGPAPTQHGSQIDHSFPFLQSLNEVLETNRAEESQSHVHRMYFMLKYNNKIYSAM